jgi:Flp pilus assembly protein TadG
VEFALVLPLVLMVALAMLQVGLTVRDRLLVSEGARAGAREAAVEEDGDQVRAAVLRAAPSLDSSRTSVLVAPPSVQGQLRDVTVDYRMPVSVPLVDWLFPNEIDLEATASMRQEFAP